jgi:hypothetical protein
LDIGPGRKQEVVWGFGFGGIGDENLDLKGNAEIEAAVA